MQTIKYFKDGTSIAKGKGKFDDECIYLVLNDGIHAPTDEETFNFFIEMKKSYDCHTIYEDFVQIYNLTDSYISKDVLDLIGEISDKYTNSNEFDKWFTTLYLCMVSEENKRYAILKKRIKRLGFHQIIFLDFNAKGAANYSYNKKARDLINDCESLGF